jgi:hypothetical protein
MSFKISYQKIVADVTSIEDDLTPAEKTKIATNIASWKKQSGGDLQKLNIAICKNGHDWTRASGYFPNAAGNKLIPFSEAMKLSAGSLEGGFERKHLLGFLGAESSFGTVFTKYDPLEPDKAVGGFQIQRRKALADFNKFNTIVKPEDIDDQGNYVDNFHDFNNASRVAAWYLARNLQYCTYKKVDGKEIGAVPLQSEAILFAVAMYNQGVGTISAARKACMGAGFDNTKYENAKAYMDAETKRYVARVVLYGKGLDMVIIKTRDDIKKR